MSILSGPEGEGGYNPESDQEMAGGVSKYLNEQRKEDKPLPPDFNPYAIHEGVGDSSAMTEDPPKESANDVTETVDSSDSLAITMEMDGQKYRFEEMRTSEDLGKIKSLDDKCFGEHQGISIEELESIRDNGHIMAFFDGDKPVAEVQLAFSAIDEHDIPEDAAYIAGTGVDPEYRSRGMGKVMASLIELLAIKEGKKKIVSSMRLENGANMRVRTSGGFEVVGYDPEYYGNEEEGGGRLLLEKSLGKGKEKVDTKTIGQEIKKGIINLANNNNIEGLIDNNMDIAVPVKSGDATDREALGLIKRIFSEGTDYRGIALIRPSEYDENADQNLLLFRSKTSQKDIDSLYDRELAA